MTSRGVFALETQVDPSPHRGQLVHIECRAYYSGVRHDSKDKLGLVQFEVQID